MVCVAGWVLAQSPDVVRLPVVFTEREAVMVAPPELMAPPEVVDAYWSPDGRYALVVRRASRTLSLAEGETPQPVQWSILLWDQRLRRGREIWSQQIARERSPMRWMEWMHGAPVALLELPVQMQQDEAGFWRQATVYARVHAPSGTLRTLGRPNQWKRVQVSPVKPFALLLGERGYQILRADGSVSALIPYERLFGDLQDERNPWTLLDGIWTEDGGRLWVVRFLRNAEGGEQKAHCVIDPLAATATLVRERPPLYSPPSPRPGLEVAIAPAELQMGEDRARVRSAWLVGKKGRVLFCADVQAAHLTPSNDAVWYISQGAAWVAPLRKVSRQQYEVLYREKIRETAVACAKQIGLALLMYVQDYDEMYPPNTGNLSDLLMPYVRNEAVFNLPGANFFYLMNMESLATIQNPSETMAGYIQTPYGRAVMWADGHVTWQDEQR